MLFINMSAYLWKMKVIYLFTCFCVFIHTVHAQTPSYGNNPIAGKYSAVRGVKLYYEEYGDGKPLVLLHGNGGSIASMSPLISCFSKQYHVIAIDSRAHGKSVDTNDSLSFEMMADDVAALLTNIKIDSACFIGWSDGGIITIEMAMRHPEKVIKFVATGANLWPDSTALIPSLWKDEKQYYDSVAVLPKHSIEEKNAWKIFLLDWLYPQITLEQLEKINKPALIICGDHDLIRLEHTVQIYQHIPAAQLWVLPNSSHGTFVDHPAQFCETVDAFFKKKT